MRRQRHVPRWLYQRSLERMRPSPRLAPITSTAFLTKRWVLRTLRGSAACGTTCSRGLPFQSAVLHVTKNMDLNVGFARGEERQTFSVRSFEHSPSQHMVATLETTASMVAMGWRLDELLFTNAADSSVRELLAELPPPSRLSIWNLDRSIGSIACLSRLTNLVDLRLFGIRTGTDLSPLSGLSKLLTLELGASSFIGTVGPLPQLPSVRNLALMGLQDVRIDLFGALPSLRSLRISLSTFRDLSFLAELGQQLSTLTLRDLNTPNGRELSLKPLEAQSRNLEALEVAFPKVPLTDLDVIGSCHALISLNLGWLPLTPELFARLTRLKSLDVCSSAGVFDLAFLRSLHSLERLNVRSDVVSVGTLKTLPALSDIRLQKVGVPDLPILATLPVRELELPDKRLRPETIEVLRACPSLQIRYRERTWSPADLYAFLAGALKLPTMKDAARKAYPLGVRSRSREPVVSHFGGGARLRADEDWPRCKNCHEPMPLFLELDLAIVPFERPLTGLLQLFYCNSRDPLCEVDCKSWDHNDQGMLIRVISDASVMPTMMPEPRGEGPTSLPMREIVLRASKIDYPDAEDAKELFGIVDKYDSKAPSTGDKMLGWPARANAARWPKCPTCLAPMLHLLQMASNRGLAHQWGDMGIAHIFLCTNHPTRTHFGWEAH